MHDGIKGAGLILLILVGGLLLGLAWLKFVHSFTEQ